MTTITELSMQATGMTIGEYIDHLRKERDRVCGTCSTCKHYGAWDTADTGNQMGDCQNPTVTEYLTDPSGFCPPPTFGCNKWSAK